MTAASKSLSSNSNTHSSQCRHQLIVFSHSGSGCLVSWYSMWFPIVFLNILAIRLGDSGSCSVFQQVITLFRLTFHKWAWPTVGGCGSKDHFSEPLWCHSGLVNLSGATGGAIGSCWCSLRGQRSFAGQLLGTSRDMGTKRLSEPGTGSGERSFAIAPSHLMSQWGRGCSGLKDKESVRSPAVFQWESLTSEVRQSASPAVEPKQGLPSSAGTGRALLPPGLPSTAGSGAVRCWVQVTFFFGVEGYKTASLCHCSSAGVPSQFTVQSALVVSRVISRISSQTLPRGAGKSWHTAISSFGISNTKWKVVLLHYIRRNVITYFHVRS